MSQRYVEKRGANHTLHLILSLLTCGLWAITGWPIAAAMGRKTVTKVPTYQPPQQTYVYPPAQQQYGQPQQGYPPQQPHQAPPYYGPQQPPPGGQYGPPQQ